jgi:UTP--glucose-1-phosphate uridylyltransferase
MLPVGRKPVVQYVVEELQDAGLSQILFITGRRKRAIEDHFDFDPQLVSILKEAGNEALLDDMDFLESRSHLFYTRQSVPKGLGHAISLGADFVDGDDCVVALGDSIIGAEDPAEPLRKMMAAHVDLNAAAVVAVEKVPEAETYRYGIVSIDGAEPPPGEPVAMTDIIEKPSPGTAPTTLAVAARYTFSPAIFEALERTLPGYRGEIQVTDAIKLLIQRGLPVYAFLLSPDQIRYDVGKFESYFQAFVDFAISDERFGYLARKYLKAKAYEL